MQQIKEELLGKLERLLFEEDQQGLGLRKNPSIGKILVKILELKNSTNKSFQKIFKEMSKEIIKLGIDFTELIEQYENPKIQKQNQEELENLLTKSANKYVDNNKKNVSIFIDEFILLNENLHEDKKSKVKNNIEAYLLEIHDYERVEFIENFRLYSEIKKELGLEEELNQIIEGFEKPKEGLKSYIKDFNKYSFNHMYIDNKLHAAKGSSNDGELFYKVGGLWKSKSLSVTKAAEYHFENVQNNTHSYKTYLKESVMNKYLKDETIQTIKKKNTSNKFSEKDNQFTSLLTYLDELNNDNLLLIQTSGFSIEDIIKYLSFCAVLHNVQDQKGISKFNGFISNMLDENKSRLTLKQFNEIPKKNLETELLNIFKRDNKEEKIIERTNKIEEILDNKYDNNKINEYKDLQSHSHDFVIYNSSLSFDKSKTVNDIICGSVLFSHIFNELKDMTEVTQNKDKILREYFDNSFNIHKSLNISIKYVKNKKVKKIPENGFDTKEFIDKIKSEEGFLTYLEELKKMLNDYTKLNKTLKDNVKVFVDSLIVSSYTFFPTNKKIKEEISEITKTNPVKNFQLSYSNNLLNKELVGKNKELKGKHEELVGKNEELVNENKEIHSENNLMMNMNQIKFRLEDKDKYEILDKIKGGRGEINPDKLINEVKTNKELQKIVKIILEEYEFKKLIKNTNTKLYEEILKEEDVEGYELSSFIVNKYFDNGKGEEKIRNQIEGMKNKNLSKLAEETELELEKTIQELLKEENIDISKEETKELSKEVTKQVINKFGR